MPSDAVPIAGPTVNDSESAKITTNAFSADATPIAQPSGNAGPDPDPEGWTSFRLESDKKISIFLPFADVRLKTGVSRKRSAARLRVWSQGTPKPSPQESQKSSKPNEKCKAELSSDSGEVRIAEAKGLGKQIAGTISGAFQLMARSIPANFECRYEVEVDAAEATDLSVKLTRGTLEIEQWKKSIQIDLDWGDVDFGTVGPLTLNCGRCTVAGENVFGALNFRINSGNVGVAGLEGPVTGDTLGDLVLKWKHLPPKSQVKLKSRAGDVVLAVPKGVPLALSLKTPRGESYTGEMTSVDGGVPFEVTAEIGNIRIYRN